MSNQIISERLKRYQTKTLEDEENALKEILQEIALYALSSTDFFSKALFQGGTSLRILYQLPRFSEDLDFILKHRDARFQWEKYVEQIKKIFMLYGIEPEVKDRSKEGETIQKLFLKDNSIGKILHLNFHHHAQRKLTIKLEIDVNPPVGSQEEMKYLDFPIDYTVLTQDLASNFAGKCHALLCRPYNKSRDWFDFSWYVARHTAVNLELLKNALYQQGPWQGQEIQITTTWLKEALKKQVLKIDWKKASKEMQRFVNLDYMPTLRLWSTDFFLNKIQQLK